MSDQQLIYCTKKISRINRGSHKQIQFRSFKYYAVDRFEQELAKLNFSNYNEINEAYNDFIQKIISMSDKVAPMRERWVKQNSKEWFDEEIADEIKNRDKLFKKSKQSELRIDKDIYNAARYPVRKTIFNKKRLFFEKNISESIGKPNDLWKTLKSLGLTNKIYSCKVIVLKINNTDDHDANSVLEGFKNYYSTLAENLVNMLPKAPNKYCIDTVTKYYEHMIQVYATLQKRF